MRAPRRAAIEARVRRARVDAEADVLECLADGWTPAASVADWLGVSLPYARALLARMEREGLVRVRLGRKQRGPGGARRLYVAVGRRP